MKTGLTMLSCVMMLGDLFGAGFVECWASDDVIVLSDTDAYERFVAASASQRIEIATRMIDKACSRIALTIRDEAETSPQFAELAGESPRWQIQESLTRLGPGVRRGAPSSRSEGGGLIRLLLPT